MQFTVVCAFVIAGLVQLQYAEGQGNTCRTPSNQRGTCVLLPQCPYLIQIYGNNPRNQQVIQYLIGSQRNCGNRSVGRDPLVCCNQPTSTSTPEPPPPPPPPTEAPVTQGPLPDVPRANAEQCTDPNAQAGVCKSIRECPIVLNEFIARPKDPEYVEYIRNSNSICNYVQPNICCPFSELDLDQGTSAPPRPTAAPTQAPRPRPPQTGDLTPRLLTVEEGCGFSNVTHTRIVGGEPAVLGGWPWMALVGYTNNLGELGWKCGGSLITTQHVLTAAHCLKSTLSTVRIGEHDLDSDTETQHYDIPVVKVAKYPSYDPKDGHNDLAILYLETPVPITNKIRPICIPTENPIRTKNFVGYQPFVAGWGRTQEGGSSAAILQELQVPVLENSVCQDRYKKLGKLISEKQFDNAVLCAGNLLGGKDSCQGDSGGPLMAPSVIDGKPIYYQIGIVSYGIGCARTDVPGVYSRVQTFVDWIRDKVAEPL